MIKIRVPATSANLGPGFDTLGLALSLYHEIQIEKNANTRQVIWYEKKCRLSDEENYVLSGIQAVLDHYHSPSLPFRLEMLRCDIPPSRGLGSSAAAYVSGIIAGLYLLDQPILREDILRVATALEGHPDNVAPAIFGGLVASHLSKSQIIHQPIRLPKPLSFVALIPEFKLSTQLAREVLPDAYSKIDVVHNLACLSVLLGAFVNGEYEYLREALTDTIHQPHRLKLMPDADILLALSNHSQTLGGFVSGAGSTYMLMCQPSETDKVLHLASQALKASSVQWQVVPLQLELEGSQWEVSEWKS